MVVVVLSLYCQWSVMMMETNMMLIKWNTQAEARQRGGQLLLFVLSKEQHTYYTYAYAHTYILRYIKKNTFADTYICTVHTYAHAALLGDATNGKFFLFMVVQQQVWGGPTNQRTTQTWWRKGSQSMYHELTTTGRRIATNKRTTQKQMKQRAAESKE